MTDFSDRILDRVRPLDYRHVEKYPMRAHRPITVAVAEHVIAVPDYRAQMDQGSEGACVGFGETWCLSAKRWHRFDAEWLYRECKKRDGYAGEGTWLQYGFDVLREEGHRRFVHDVERDAVPAQGITANRWCQDVDDVRTTLAADDPIAFGIDWFTNYDAPVQRDGEWWIGLGDRGSVRGGHCICAFKVSDRRQAVGLVNSWGMLYPIVWFPYTEIAFQLTNGNEAGAITLR